MTLSIPIIITRAVHKVLFISAILVQFTQVNAQYFTNFNQIKPMYNPSAIWEDDNLIKIKAIYRNQWAGFQDQTLGPGQVSPNVSPQTFVLNAAFQLRMDSVTPSRWALGIQIMDDRFGYIKTTTTQIQTAYQIPLTKSNSQLSIGAGFGLTQFGINGTFKFRTNSDSVVRSSDQSVDFSGGVFYQKETFKNKLSHFYLGFSANHINTPEFAINFSSTPIFSIYRLNKDFNLVSGVNIETGNPLVVFEPSILLKYNSILQFQMNATVKYNNTFRGGFGYRQVYTSDALSIILGYQTKKLQVGYSYDIALTKIRTVSYGSHEIFASYSFGKK